MSKLDNLFRVTARELEKKHGRVLQLGERVQEGDLVCCMPDDLWITATCIGLIVSDCDVGWYRRPAKGAKS
jgi:hypothetical protein